MEISTPPFPRHALRVRRSPVGAFFWRGMPPDSAKTLRRVQGESGDTPNTG